MNQIVAIILILVVGIASAIAVVWSYYLRRRSLKRGENLLVSPYYARYACGTEQFTDVTGVSEEDDPTRVTYRDVNYCLTNAPRCEIIAMIKKHIADGETQLTKLMPDKIMIPFLQFYAEFIDTCGYSLTGANPVDTSETLPPDYNDPNKDDYVEGPNNDFLKVMVGVCTKRYGTSDESKPGAVACAALAAKLPPS